jgi:hypothetical protein
VSLGRGTRARWDYARSNQIERLDYVPSPATRDLAAALLDGHPAEREQPSNELLARMASELSVPPVSLRFLNSPQKHRRRGGRLTYKEYAFYEPGGRITIYNVTAVRRQYLAPRSYLDTLVHEFLHHLDYHLLGLEHTFHTRGFYSRLADLMGKLTPAHSAQLELF